MMSATKIDIVEELGFTSAVRRMAALKSLGERTALTEEERDALFKTFHEDPNQVVRHEAAFLLSSLTERDWIDREVAQAALIKRINDPSILVRHEIALSLASFPGLQSEAALRKLQNDPEPDVQISATVALEQLTGK
jgi:HEAT repeat protein